MAAKRQRANGDARTTSHKAVVDETTKGYRVRLKGKGIDDDLYLPAAECDPVLLANFEAVKGIRQPVMPAGPEIPQDTAKRAARQAKPASCVVPELELPSVPEYNPTAEKFANPLEYIRSIYDQASLYGVAIINPPKESWDFQVTRDAWQDGPFDCKIQKLLDAPRKVILFPRLGHLLAFAPHFGAFLRIAAMPATEATA